MKETIETEPKSTVGLIQGTKNRKKAIKQTNKDVLQFHKDNPTIEKKLKGLKQEGVEVINLDDFPEGIRKKILNEMEESNIAACFLPLSPKSFVYRKARKGRINLLEAKSYNELMEMASDLKRPVIIKGGAVNSNKASKKAMEAQLLHEIHHYFQTKNGLFPIEMFAKTGNFRTQFTDILFNNTESTLQYLNAEKPHLERRYYKNLLHTLALDFKRKYPLPGKYTLETILPKEFQLEKHTSGFMFNNSKWFSKKYKFDNLRDKNIGLTLNQRLKQPLNERLKQFKKWKFEQTIESFNENNYLFWQIMKDTAAYLMK